MAADIMPVVFLMGPTASGKTDLATKLYDAISCELVSVDAAQVYRGMDIGTAKPDKDFLSRYPHHLLDITSIENPYSAADFCQDAARLIGEISARGSVPILVGGTMFYFRALEKGLNQLPASEPSIRSDLMRELEEHGLASLHDRLERVDPETANRISSKDSQRTLRALEIFHASGIPPSQLMKDSVKPWLEGRLLKLTLFCGDRGVLHRQIGRRFDEMLEQGLVSEVEQLLAGPGERASLSAFRTVGYRQVLQYLQGELDLDEMRQRAKAATRQLAKRQLTWLRNQSNQVWFDAGNDNTIDAVLGYLRNSHPAFSGLNKK